MDASGNEAKVASKVHKILLIESGGLFFYFVGFFCRLYTQYSMVVDDQQSANIKGYAGYLIPYQASKIIRAHSHKYGE